MARSGSSPLQSLDVIESGEKGTDADAGIKVFAEDPTGKAVAFKTTGRDGGKSLKVIDHYSHLQKAQLKKLDVISKKLDVLQPSGGGFDTEDETLE